ncbi:uncharacterized protein OCT59_005719 [Rhizophagus irregularis]|uniref:uncharacterized protein n=1 Tax=Rhizophagus irregularis TaxID=588596 RepID=UPI003321AA4B|nr:hypothetical protein OCT59_005719 [Rhizophagus irregularis]
MSALPKSLALAQQEILNWHNYFFEFESKVDALIADSRIKDKTARSTIYKEMKPFLPTKITQANLRKKTHRARKHLMLFGKNGIGLDKIKLVSYSATKILKLTNAQIQNVIDQGMIRLSTSANVLSIFSSNQSKPTYDRSYFCNKTLNQYPNLYREFSSENFDYYGITDRHHAHYTG